MHINVQIRVCSWLYVPHAGMSAQVEMWQDSMGWYYMYAWLDDVLEIQSKCI